MTCTARLYETGSGGYVPLSSASVELVAVDQASLANLSTIQNNASLPGGGRGATMSFAASSIVYQVAIADTAAVHAGFTVLNLNGAKTGDLDLVVHALPTHGRAGSTATITTAAQARASVLNHPFWTVQEKLGLLGVMAAYVALRPSQSPVVARFVRLYVSVIDGFGIDPSIL